MGIALFLFYSNHLQIESLSPLVFISPRGLISILLFLQIAEIKFLENTPVLIDEKSAASGYFKLNASNDKRYHEKRSSQKHPLEEDITIPSQTAVLQNQEGEIDNNLPSEEQEEQET